MENTILKPIIISEDGVQLFEGDNYFRAGRSKPDATGKFKLFEGINLRSCHFVCSYPEVDKAFYIKEKAEKWIEEQNTILNID